jgi:hypothetical protein
VVEGVKSDDPDSEEISECESDLESLSVGSFDILCETFFRSADACLSENGFPDGFSRLDLISLGWSVLSIYPTVAEIFLMGGLWAT